MKIIYKRYEYCINIKYKKIINNFLESKKQSSQQFRLIIFFYFTFVFISILDLSPPILEKSYSMELK